MAKPIGLPEDDDNSRRSRRFEQIRQWLNREDVGPAVPAQAPTATNEAPTAPSDVVEANRVGNTWMKKIKAVPKPVAAQAPKTLQSFEPASSSRGLKQAQSQHDHIGESLGAAAGKLRELDGKIASFALDPRSPSEVANLAPAMRDALAQREALIDPVASRLGQVGTSEEKERFAIYERWMGNVLSVAERRLG